MVGRALKLSEYCRKRAPSKAWGKIVQPVKALGRRYVGVLGKREEKQSKEGEIKTLEHLIAIAQLAKEWERIRTEQMARKLHRTAKARERGSDLKDRQKSKRREKKGRRKSSAHRFQRSRGRGQ